MRVLLNLLPEEGRAVIRRKYYARFFFWQSMLLLSIEVFYLVILGGVFLVVREKHAIAAEAEAERARTQVEAKALASYESKFRDANRLSDQSNRFDREHIGWTELLRRLDRIVPDGVAIVSLSTKDYQVFVVGMAEEREDFLEMEKRLKEESCFPDIKAPVTNLFSEKNVEFQIDFSVKPECIKSATNL